MEAVRSDVEGESPVSSSSSEPLGFLESASDADFFSAMAARLDSMRERSLVERMEAEGTSLLVPRLSQSVSWLPPLILSDAVLFAEVESVLPPGSAFPFARVRWGGEWDWDLPVPATYRAEMLFEDHSSRWLAKALLLAYRGNDRSPAALDFRHLAWEALLAGKAVRRMRALGSPEAYASVLSAERDRYLASIDKGRPLKASAIRLAQLRAPNAFIGLGRSLPSEEVLSLVRRRGGAVELGAGMGLFARALRQAGLPVEASDLGVEDHGLAFPVRAGIDGSEEDVAGALARLRSEGAEDPLLCVLWPRMGSDWHEKALSKVPSGSAAALASPELEFLFEGYDELQVPGGPHRYAEVFGEGMIALRGRLDADFVEEEQAPLGTVGFGVPVPFRVFRRR